MKQGKLWGTTEEVYNDGYISVNLLTIKAGGYCSEHKHAHKANRFFIVAGALQLSQWVGMDGDGPPDVTCVNSGQSTAIPAGVWHSFLALEDTWALEIYDVRLEADDIIRRTHGGMR